MKEQKANIINKSWDLFFQYGIKSVTMDDIALEMGISKKTLYQNFANKKDLVEQAMVWEVDHPRFSFRSEDIKDLNAVDQYLEFFQFVNEKIKESCLSMEYDLKKYYPEIWKKFKLDRQERFLQELQLNISKGIQEGYYRSEINVELISKTLVQLYLNLVGAEYKVFSDEEVSSVELHRELTIYHLHGICTQKGIEYFKNKLK